MADHGRFDVRGHVVGPLHGVDEEGEVFGDDVVEDGLEIDEDVGVGRFVDGDGGGGVLDEQVQQAGVG